MAKDPRVVIVGGGIVGLCTAYFCAKRGLRTVVLEREESGHRGCSWGNAGIVVPSHFEPLAAPGMVAVGIKMMLRRESPFSFSAKPSREMIQWARRFWRAGTPAHVERCAPVLAGMHLASRKLFESLQKDIGGFGFETGGMAMLCQTEKGFQHEIRLAERAHKLGISARVMNTREFRESQQGLLANIVGAVHYTDDRYLSPGALLEALAGYLTKQGVAILYESPVQGFRMDGALIAAAMAKEGEIPGDQFVLAGGAWTPQLAAQFGLDLPIVAGRGYSMTLPAPPQSPRCALLLQEARVAITPMLGGLRIGGTMEIDRPRLAVNEAKVRGIRRSVGAFLPAFEEKAFRGAEVWCGLRPISADGMPFIGGTKRVPNLQIAAGHGMMGLSLGPITGSTVAATLAGEPEERGRLLDPDRYG